MARRGPRAATSIAETLAETRAERVPRRVPSRGPRPRAEPRAEALAETRAETRAERRAETRAKTRAELRAETADRAAQWSLLTTAAKADVLQGWRLNTQLAADSWQRSGDRRRPEPATLKAPNSKELDMSSTQMPSETAIETPRARTVDMKLEVVVIPVSDVDRAKQFYGNLGWRLDADFIVGDAFRGVQFTPPGSPASIHFGTGITSAAPGTAQGLYLVVSDIVAARAELIGRGVNVSEVFHRAGRDSRRSMDRIRSGAATSPMPPSAIPTGTAGCCRRSPCDCPDALMHTTRHSPRRLSSRPLSAVRRPRTASTRSGPASTMRTGPTGTPSTSSGSRPARSCRHEQRPRWA